MTALASAITQDECGLKVDTSFPAALSASTRAPHLITRPTRLYPHRRGYAMPSPDMLCCIGIVMIIASRTLERKPQEDIVGTRAEQKMEILVCICCFLDVVVVFVETCFDRISPRGHTAYDIFYAAR